MGEGNRPEDPGAERGVKSVSTMQRIAEACEKLRLALRADRRLSGRRARALNVFHVRQKGYSRNRTKAVRRDLDSARTYLRGLADEHSKVLEELRRARRWLDTLLLRLK